MTARIMMIALLLGPLGAAAVLADEFTQQDAEEMAFQELGEQEQKAALAMLQGVMEESLDEAEKQIREQGGVVPFAYVMNNAGQGQFLRFSEDEQVPAELAAQTLERAIVRSAFQGNLVASAMYITAPGTDELGDEMEGDIAEDLEGSRSLSDVNFLIAEAQHLAGISVIHVTPYWENDEGEWVFGESHQATVEPRLSQLVQRTFEQARQRQQQ